MSEQQNVQGITTFRKTKMEIDDNSVPAAVAG